MKKLVLPLVVIFILVTLLTGCSGNGDASKLANANSELAKAKQQLDAKQQEIENLTGKLNLAKKNKITNRKNEDKSYISTEDLLFWLVVRFDNSWITYINNNDQEIFNYMVKNSDLYHLAIQFKKSHSSTQEYITSIEMDNVEVTNDDANIYVTEVVNEQKNNSTKTITYHWVYSAKKIKGIWYLEKMQRQE